MLQEAEIMNIHQITKLSGLEDTFKGNLVYPLCSDQGHLQLDLVAQSPIQPDFKCFQR